MQSLCDGVCIAENPWNHKFCILIVIMTGVVRVIQEWSREVQGLNDDRVHELVVVDIIKRLTEEYRRHLMVHSGEQQIVDPRIQEVTVVLSVRCLVGLL